ncbi:thioredoxin domain-containing protein [Alkalinema sp. FACHB-956]|uniref:thioredoxin family protein n=1 Tax=Alkalinema sp. FACHB-956 TaxID=2692768 RepID=UPI001689DA8C|nr:thioredoxin domain-containing protein [Alkalinema sp. FACHB-956]MBD2327460.1 redoxin domain-containing protein [Alkalinema sp. FACHB-956]
MPSVINEQAFAQEVLQSSTPVLVHFWAPWCGVCRMIEPALERVRSEFGESLKLVGINADENLKLTSNYRITNLPTVLVFKEGRLLHRLEKLHRKDEVKSSLEKVISLIH